MSKIFISTFDDNGTKKFALYDDRSTPATIFSEDWKPVVFDNEDDAKAMMRVYSTVKQISTGSFSRRKNTKF